MLTTVYPNWFILLCILAGAIYAGILYFKNYFSKNKSIFNFPSGLLMFLRFASISLICFFLLSPFLKKNFRKDEKPLIILAADNSSSILLNKDSAYYQNDFLGEYEKLKRELQKKYEVIDFSFGNKVETYKGLDFSENRTNMYNLLDYLYEQYFNRNIGAIVLASDGNYNEGRDPMLLIKDFKAPFYTIALGDTSPPADLFIKEVRNNSIAYLGNSVPIKITVGAEKFKSKQARLSLLNNGKNIKNWDIQVKNNRFSTTIDYLYEAKVAGLQNFSLRLTELKGEISYVNNVKDFYLDVLESRKKIMIIANSPHPDVFAIRHSIEKNDNYSVSAYLIKDIISNPALYEPKISAADLIILHQLPSNQQSANRLFSKLENDRIPILFVLGSQTSMASFNKLDLGFSIQQRGNNFEEALPLINTSFNFFNLAEKSHEILKEYPPLQVPFGKYLVTLNNQVLFNQQIGQVKSTYPLMLFIQDVDKRLGFINGEGIWRWPLTETKITRKQEVFDEIMSKTIQFLSTREDKRYFRLRNFNNSFYEDQAVVIEVELYNQSYEPQHDAEINLTIHQTEDNKNFSFQFRETDDGYRVNAGFLKPGKYSFTATTHAGGKIQSLGGEFTVLKVEVEFLNTIANHQLLFNMASERNGKMFYPAQMDQIADSIQTLDLKPRSSFEIESRDLIELKWLFFLIVLLLFVEWFFRKFFGSY